MWTLAAAYGIQRAHDCIVDFNPRAAMRVAEDLHAAGNSPANSPLRGHPVPGTIMRELVVSHRYIIRYRIEVNDVIILRIRHIARRPTTP